MRHPAVPYVAPFLVFVSLMAVERLLPMREELFYPFRFALTLAVTLVTSRQVIQWQPKRVLGSLFMGLAVFLIWVAPDLLWPGYREHWLFHNSLLGSAKSSLPPAARNNPLLILIRVAGSVALVPVLEELFWRGWLMRWLIKTNFRKVPLGAYTAFSFWMVAVAFASEHGPYWEVGLIAGIAYNWWMVRTRSLADCILSHAVTNACLSAFVLHSGRWEYWL